MPVEDCGRMRNLWERSSLAKNDNAEQLINRVA